MGRPNKRPNFLFTTKVICPTSKKSKDDRSCFGCSQVEPSFGLRPWTLPAAPRRASARPRARKHPGVEFTFCWLGANERNPTGQKVQRFKAQPSEMAPAKPQRSTPQPSGQRKVKFKAQVDSFLFAGSHPKLGGMVVKKVKFRSGQASMTVPKEVASGGCDMLGMARSKASE